MAYHQPLVDSASSRDARSTMRGVLGLSSIASAAAVAAAYALFTESSDMQETLSWATVNGNAHLGVNSLIHGGASVSYTDAKCALDELCAACGVSSTGTVLLMLVGAAAAVVSLVPTYRRANLFDCEEFRSTGVTTTLVSTMALTLAALNFSRNCQSAVSDDADVDAGLGFRLVCVASLAQAMALLGHVRTEVEERLPVFSAPVHCQAPPAFAAPATYKFNNAIVPARQPRVAATPVRPASTFKAPSPYTNLRYGLTARRAKQDFLESEPMPLNTYKNKEPFTGKVISVERIVGANATGETCNVVIDHGGKMPYWEGQSYGVIPPGTNPKNGKPHTVRLYSIASSRYGDDMTGNTTTLCVRRATYWDPELGREDPAKKGVCSNYLCDAQPGDEVKLTGPSGKVMLLPESTPEADIIMVATGTGIAPYRSFLKRIFVEDTPYAATFKGLAWLFLGVANSDALLYDEDWKKIQAEHPDQFRYDVALSREQTNKDGGKMYIQDRVEEYADEIFERLDNGAHIYFCGLKGMMPGIQSMLERVATSKGLDYAEFIGKLKKNHQWHVEVY